LQVVIIDLKTEISLACRSGRIYIIRMNLLKRFLKDEQGQDLIEYTLLMAFIALASAAIFVNSGKMISGIWSSANVQLVAANAAAS
jgi:Flp pilus assembly pilin Flp